jgi:hypothetical protein
MSTPGGFSVGSVHVDVDVDAKGVKQQLEAAVSGVDATIDVKLDLPDFKAKKKQIEADLSPVEVDVDVKVPTKAELQAIKQRMTAALGPLNVKVGVDLKAPSGIRLAVFRAALQARLGDIDVKVNLVLPTRLRTFKKQLQAIVGKSYKVNVTAHVTRVTVSSRVSPIRIRAHAVVTSTSGGGGGGGLFSSKNPFGKGRGFLSGDFPEAFLKILNPFGVAMAVARGTWRAFDLIGQGATKLGGIFTKAAGAAGRFGKVFAGLGRVLGTVGGAVASAAAPIAVVLGVAAFGTIIDLITQISPLINGLVGIVVLLGSAIGQAALAGLTAVPVLISLGAALGVAAFAGKDAFTAIGSLFKAMSSGDPKDLEAYAEALGKLGPNARAAVRAFEPLLANLKDIRKEAEQNMFAGMAESVAAFAPVVELVKGSVAGIATAIGDVIDGFLRLGENTFFLDSLRVLLDAIPPIVTNIGNAFTDVFAGLTNFFSFLTPIATEFSNAVARAGERFLAWTQSEGTREKVQTFFTNAYNIAKDVVGIVWALGGVIMAVFTASQGPLSENKNILQLIKDKLNEWKAWLEDPANGAKIKAWFDEAKRLAVQVWQAVETIIKKFQEWNTPENQAKLGDTVKAIEGIVTALMNVISAAQTAWGWVTKVLELMGLYNPPAMPIPSGATTNMRQGTVPRNGGPFARGGIVGTPTYALIGEAGPEAIIPLRRPIGAMDPAVRRFALTIRGSEEPTGGKRVQVTQNIYPSQADPSNVANSVLRQLTYAAGR